MNQHSLVQHYEILKSLKEISHALFLNDSNDLPFRMKWELMETETDTYVLFSTKKSAALQLVRVNKTKQAGYTIARFSVETKNYQPQPNKIYKDGTGFLYAGDETTLRFVEPGKKEPEVLECLPLYTVRNLLLDDGLEELEFQYGTLHNFEGDSFEMYCLFSLLHNVDDIGNEVKSGYHNRLSFLDVVGNGVLDSLVQSISELKVKLLQDLENA